MKWASEDLNLGPAVVSAWLSNESRRIRRPLSVKALAFARASSTGLSYWPVNKALEIYS